jgi:hypothetical protein
MSPAHAPPAVNRPEDGQHQRAALNRGAIEAGTGEKILIGPV